jgi:hypothetical protein
MAILLAVARAIQDCSQKHPREAAQYFMAAYNAVLDVTPPAAVWVWQIIKFEERFDQHKLECKTCQPHPNELDCKMATELKSRLTVYRARLAEAEAWGKSHPTSTTQQQP